eukprot:CAMPEP_0115151158 /NCGR_PEP_ID=MMETSP0227-20121206/65439_1 /TAXON_ID=89957 /ORGANISM="Polarella glacialis, Strain CCMP 1383" /LENGTH=114 /DNA_ID=CAMNT_0002561603 /DNA_START=314 /DNA_END=657 /DNA_ORIENTATION=-
MSAAGEHAAIGGGPCSAHSSAGEARLEPTLQLATDPAALAALVLLIPSLALSLFLTRGRLRCATRPTAPWHILGLSALNVLLLAGTEKSLTWGGDAAATSPSNSEKKADDVGAM